MLMHEHITIADQITAQITKKRNHELESLIAAYLKQNPDALISELQLCETTYGNLIEGRKISWHVERRVVRYQDDNFGQFEPGDIQGGN